MWWNQWGSVPKREGVIIGFIVILLFLLLFSNVYARCAEDKTACFEECDKACAQKKYDYCRTYEYSGCALDVFCDCNKCELLDSKWCPEKGYNSCAAGPISRYETCIQSCQMGREAGNDVSTCWKDCNDQLAKGLTPCKDAQCETSCTAQGYENGKWATYTPAGGYDSCECLGEQVAASEPELFPGVADNAEPSLDVMENSEPQQFPDAVKPKPDEDPFKDYWDYSSAEQSILNKLKYLFTSEENTGRRGQVGFVKAIKDKDGVRVYRNGKWMGVGVHTPLFPEDRLRTGPNSKVNVVLLNTDGTQDILDIRSNSLFEPEGTRYEDHDDSIRIVKFAGSMIATIKRRIQGNKPNFYVKTPTVTSGIRGTKFYLSYDTSTNVTSLMVSEGEVELAGATTAIVKAGEQIKAEKGVLGEIEDLDTAKWDELTKQDWDEEASEGLLSVPAVKALLVLIILAGTWIGYKKFSKQKR